MKSETIFNMEGLSKIIDRNISIAHDDIFLKSAMPIPGKLFKYYGNIDYAVDAIVNGRIHLESPREYNDPYDSSIPLEEKDLYYIRCDRSFPLIMVILMGEEKNHFLKEYQQAHAGGTGSYGEYLDFICSRDESLDKKELADQLLKMMQYEGIYQPTKFKISCFSERNDSLLMWAYYAKSYTGVCVGFNMDLDSQLSKAAQKVNYSYNTRKDITEASFLFNKGMEWSHEQEWRVVLETNDNYLSTCAISDVILGNRISTEDFIKIGALVKKYNLKLHRVAPRKERYELEVTELSSELVKKIGENSEKLIELRKIMG